MKGCREQQHQGLAVSHGSCLQATRGSELLQPAHRWGQAGKGHFNRMTYSCSQQQPCWTQKSPQEPLVNELTPDFSMERDRLQLETLNLFLISLLLSKRVVLGLQWLEREELALGEVAGLNQGSGMKNNKGKNRFHVNRATGIWAWRISGVISLSIYTKYNANTAMFLYAVPFSSIYNLTIIFNPGWLILGH